MDKLWSGLWPFVASRDGTRRERLRMDAGVASAAHQMSSPLCTIAVLAEELLRRPLDPALREDLQLLSSQVHACRRILHDLLVPEPGGSDGGRAQADETPADLFVEALCRRWAELRPNVQPIRQLAGQGPAPKLRGSRLLEQALINLLDNAADESPGDVRLTCDWRPGQLELRILDRGRGIPHALRGVLGTRVYTSKPGRGAGIGLVLAQHAIARAGGQLRLLERSGGGTCALVTLPVRTALPSPRAWAGRLLRLQPLRAILH